jgi:hypothetical protein
VGDRRARALGRLLRARPRLQHGRMVGRPGQHAAPAARPGAFPGGHGSPRSTGRSGSSRSSRGSGGSPHAMPSRATPTRSRPCAPVARPSSSCTGSVASTTLRSGSPTSRPSSRTRPREGSDPPPRRPAPPPDRRAERGHELQEPYERSCPPSRTTIGPGIFLSADYAIGGADGSPWARHANGRGSSVKVALQYGPTRGCRRASCPPCRAASSS